jgi:hypothetical protein
MNPPLLDHLHPPELTSSPAGLPPHHFCNTTERTEQWQLQRGRKSLWGVRWMGHRAQFCLGRPLPSPGTRLRAPARNAGRIALSGLCYLTAASLSPSGRSLFLKSEQTLPSVGLVFPSLVFVWGYILVYQPAGNRSREQYPRDACAWVCSSPYKIKTLNLTGAVMWPEVGRLQECWLNRKG